MPDDDDDDRLPALVKSGLSRLVVSQEVMGSNPIRGAGGP